MPSAGSSYLAGIEQSTCRDTWRNPTARDADYLQRLADWGYVLSDVEHLVLTTHPNGAVMVDASDAAEDQTSDTVGEVPIEG